MTHCRRICPIPLRCNHRRDGLRILVLPHALPRARVGDPPRAGPRAGQRGHQGMATRQWPEAHQHRSRTALMENDTPGKEWYTSPGFGGNSKCWMGGTTRMMPARLQIEITLWRRHGLAGQLRGSREATTSTVENVMLDLRARPVTPMHALGTAPAGAASLLRPRHAAEHPHFPDGWFRHVHRPRQRRHGQTWRVLCQRHMRAVSGRCEIHHPERARARSTRIRASR